MSIQGLTSEEAHRAVEHLLAAGVAPSQLEDYMNDIIVLVEAGLDAYFTEILFSTRA